MCILLSYMVPMWWEGPCKSSVLRVGITYCERVQHRLAAPDDVLLRIIAALNT